MSKTDHANSAAVFITKLSIERCQMHLAHLHALMHLCYPPGDSFLEGSFLKVMETIEGELSYTEATLSHFE